MKSSIEASASSTKASTTSVEASLEAASKDASTEVVKLPRVSGVLSRKQLLLEASGCFHGIPSHYLLPCEKRHIPLPWKLVGASIEAVEASMEVGQASIEVVEYSV